MISRKIKTFITFIIVSLVAINNSQSIEPDIFVQSTVNRASEALGGEFSKEEKILKLMSIAKETVDINGIGFYTIGTYKKGMSEDQKKEYSFLFDKYFLKSFASRLAEYSNPEIEVKSKRKINDKYTMVSSVLVATDERPEVKIDWRIYTKNTNNPLIRDLIIEGLSLARTQKEEFSSIIQSNDGDINALFATLKEFVK